MFDWLLIVEIKSDYNLPSRRRKQFLQSMFTFGISRSIGILGNPIWMNIMMYYLLQSIMECSLCCLKDGGRWAIVLRNNWISLIEARRCQLPCKDNTQLCDSILIIKEQTILYLDINRHLFDSNAYPHILCQYL